VFAKHLGHMVRVQGVMDSTGSGKFEVTTIELISGSCHAGAK
jgi:hypothetical protein